MAGPAHESESASSAISCRILRILQKNYDGTLSALVYSSLKLRRTRTSPSDLSVGHEGKARNEMTSVSRGATGEKAHEASLRPPSAAPSFDPTS